MPETARKTPDAEPVRHERLPIERLLASLAGNAIHNVSIMVAGTADARDWTALETTIHRFLKGDLIIAAERIEAVRHEAERLLQRFDPSGERRDSYANTCSGLERHAENGLPTLPVEIVARRLYEALLWYTAWHLLAANCRMPRVIRVLDARPGRAPARDMRLPSMPWRRAVPAGSRFMRAAGTVGTAVARDLGKRSKAGLDAFRASRAEHAAQAAAAAQQVRCEAEAAELEKRAREKAERAPARRFAPGDDVPATTPASLMNLDGHRLRGSVIGTWIMLVVLSWVSLFWGALISAPVGIGFGIAATAVVGVVIVPLWGTLWGFLTMGHARDSTLRQMGFKSAPEWSFVVEVTDRYSKALGIPMPQVGTIPAFNAFAMGRSVHDATIAIGEPLTTRLNPAELAAVIGHELGHVVSGDMRRMMLMRTFQNATVWFAFAQGVKQFARWVICWAAELAILAFSRRREYWADAIGAGLAGKEAMIGALRKLDAAPALSSAENTHARFMFRALGSTHPSTADRIRALEQETYIRRLPQRSSR